MTYRTLRAYSVDVLAPFNGNHTSFQRRIYISLYFAFVANVGLTQTPISTESVSVPPASFFSWLQATMGIELVKIRAGTFLMGSPPDEPGRMPGMVIDQMGQLTQSPIDDEVPQTRVTLTKDFYFGATVITQGQYRALLGYEPSSVQIVSAGEPMRKVSWTEAMGFCKKLTRMARSGGQLPDDWELTLPTEAQWEYACRAGTTGPYPDDLDAIAWYGKNSSQTIHPVGKKQPNAWGLFDILGNVGEWCFDRYGRYPGGSIIDPHGPELGNAHIYRGGSWNNVAAVCRSATRFEAVPDVHGDRIGFRLALNAVPDEQRLAEQESQMRFVNLKANLPTTIGEIVSRLAADTGIKLIAIPAGTLKMGHDRSDELERGFADGPQTRVTLSNFFFIGATDVTQEQYATVVGKNPSHFKNAGKDAPVENVSWNDAMEFCGRLTELERVAEHLPKGYVFTLPTEAQWEYAFQAGTPDPFEWEFVFRVKTPDPFAGDLDAIAWFSKNSGGITHAVGLKQPNAWGLYNMHGNVWQWCRDWRDNYPGGAVTDPSGPPGGAYRVARGGAWSDGGSVCRFEDRCGHSPEDRTNDLGFRVVLDADVPLQAKGSSRVQTPSVAKTQSVPEKSSIAGGISVNDATNNAAAPYAPPGTIGATRTPRPAPIGGGAMPETIELRDAPLALAANLLHDWSGTNVTVAPSLSNLRVTYVVVGKLTRSEAIASMIAAIKASNVGIGVVISGDGAIQILDLREFH